MIGEAMRIGALFAGVLFVLSGIGTVLPAWARYVRDKLSGDEEVEFDRRYHVGQWLRSGGRITIGILLMSIYFSW